MKFETAGFHPIQGHALNVVEQINQTWTYLVALAAARHLLEMHPEAKAMCWLPRPCRHRTRYHERSTRAWSARKPSPQSIQGTTRRWSWIYRSWLPGPNNIATCSLCRRPITLLQEALAMGAQRHSGLVCPLSRSAPHPRTKTLRSSFSVAKTTFRCFVPSRRLYGARELSFTKRFLPMH